ncbi:MAG: glycoside hydrolase family 2, partial [Oscillospiraceae bacterium]|nr:glycoside hydrolase family 2 [Oscillospiraceae bacterium]
SVTITVEGISGFTAQVEGKCYHFEGGSGTIEVETPCLWTPENPHLYPLTITAGEDRVESYFALRTIEIKKYSGVNRVLLNGKPIFLHGVLDQGYFSDGIFLPGEPEEYERDILRMKGLGLNLLRKHIKIEPEQFYYDCDRLGMLVMQDMVNSGGYNFLRDTALPTIGLQKIPDTWGSAHDKRKDFFRQHMLDTLRHLHNHPCVVAYTIFNEGWGQFHSDELYELAKAADSSRLYDSTSGWFTQKKNDFDSQHVYFRLKKLTPGERPLLLSECGGYTLAVPGHLYNSDKQYGYGACKNSEELTDKIVEMYEKMVFPAVLDGCCGCIYTQLSDVEEEINGFYTYDRQVRKVEQEKLLRIASKLKYIMNAL